MHWGAADRWLHTLDIAMRVLPKPLAHGGAAQQAWMEAGVVDDGGG